MLRKILISTDGSRGARKALDFASDLARKYGATLHLVHVMQDMKASDDFIAFHEAEHVEEPPRMLYLRETGNRVIGDAKTLLLRSGSGRVDPAARRGNPSAEMLHHAKKNDVDTIVVGHREPGMIESLFAGSVAEKVCHRAECTCVTVK